MINTSDRGEAIKLIDEAIAAGARQAQACSELGLRLSAIQAACKVSSRAAS